MHDRTSRELGRQWDGRDPLARFRKQFYRPTSQIYLAGSALGLCSQESERALLRALANWKTKGSDGWTEASADWTAMGQQLATRVAALVGAAADQVAIANSTALNLHQLLATLYRRQFHRPRLLIDGFCSLANRAVLRSHLELRGLEARSQLLIVPPDEARLLDEETIEAALADPGVQIAFLPAVVGATGQLLDVDRLCRAAHRAGVIIGLDLSHSLGMVPHALDDWGADFAIWGHGHFLDAGPGAPAGVYLNRRHFDEVGGVHAGLAGGWNGNEEPGDDLFSTVLGGGGAASLQIGLPPILSMAPLDGALRVIEEAGLERIRAKSLDLTTFLRCAIEDQIPTLDFVTPKELERRGGHLSLRHPAAREICEALRGKGLSADYREPDYICLAPAPLYNSFVECWDAVQILRRVVEAKVAASLRQARELVS